MYQDCHLLSLVYGLDASGLFSSRLSDGTTTRIRDVGCDLLDDLFLDVDAFHVCLHQNTTTYPSYQARCEVRFYDEAECC